MNDQPFSPLPDIQSWPLFAQKDGYYNYLVGSVTADHYLVVDEKRHNLVMRIIQQLQDGVTPLAIQETLAREGIYTDVRAFVQQLKQSGLLMMEEKDRTSQETKPFFSQLRILSWDVVSITLEGWWQKLAPVSRYFHPFFLLMVAFTTLAVLGLVIFSGRELSLHQLFSARKHLGLPHLILSYLSVMLIAIPLHETAHALFATEKQIYPRRITVRLYMLVIPFFSLQLPGLYTLPTRHRLLTIAAGPLMNLLLGNIALLLSWSGSLSPSPQQSFLMAFAAINYATFLFNLTPFLPLDGYQILSQAFFRELDVRSNAWASMRRWIQSRKRISPLHLAFVIIDSLFLSLLLYIIVVQINHYIDSWILRWSAPLITFNPHLPAILLLSIDVFIVGFATYRLSSLMGIRQAIKR